MTAVRGTFADFKTVKTRGVCQLIIEVPIEAADHALATLGGVPQAKAEQWVGIAPVTAPDKPVVARPAPPAPPAEQTPAELERLKGGARAKRAGILGNEGPFRLFIRQNYELLWSTHTTEKQSIGDRTAVVVRLLCGVSSRAELDHNARAGIIWDHIDRNYRAALEGRTTADLETMRDGR